jgi:RNA polymerase sigma-70 factor (ECF subfamily)
MTDPEIIQDVLKGNKDNFRILVDEHQASVFHIAMGFVHDRDEAKDLTQEVFIQTWQSLGKFRGDSSFSTWLHRIAVNACLNNARKKRGSRVLNRITSLFSYESYSETQVLSFADNPEEILIREEHSNWLQKALDSIPEKQRTAIILSKYDDLPQKEIATIMNLSEGAVEALLQRGKKNLREKLSTGTKKIKLNRRK